MKVWLGFSKIYEYVPIGCPWYEGTYSKIYEYVPSYQGQPIAFYLQNLSPA